MTNKDTALVIADLPELPNPEADSWESAFTHDQMRDYAPLDADEAWNAALEAVGLKLLDESGKSITPEQYLKLLGAINKIKRTKADR